MRRICGISGAISGGMSCWKGKVQEDIVFVYSDTLQGEKTPCITVMVTFTPGYNPKLKGFKLNLMTFDSS